MDEVPEERVSVDDKPQSAWADRIRSPLALLFAVLGAVSAALVFTWTIFVTSVKFPYWADILRDHFAAIIGLPGAVAISFCIVVFLRQTDGPVEFEGLGFKFKGAAGQVVMWVLCFLAISAAIKMCW